MAADNDIRVEIREYPDDTNKGYQTLVLRNHWNRKDRLQLEIEGKTYTFIIDHIRKGLDAIEAGQ